MFTLLFTIAICYYINKQKDKFDDMIFTFYILTMFFDAMLAMIIFIK
jgi:hypothetical protein